MIRQAGDGRAAPLAGATQWSAWKRKEFVARGSRRIHTHQRQHIKRVDQVRQRLGGVVDLHRPAQVVLQVIGHLHHVRRFDDPLAATRGDEETQHRRIHTHQQGVGVVGGDGGEERRDMVRQGLAVAALDHRHQCGDRTVQRGPFTSA